MSLSTPKPPAALVRHIREGRCVLFAGAGLSMQAGLPSWPGLLRKLVAAVEEQSPGAGGDEIERLFKKNKLLAIADFCKQELGERAYAQALAEQTRGADEELSEAHELVAEIPFSAVVTTNYDHLLRRAFSANGGVPRTPTHLDADVLAPLLFEGGFFILKAHGDIDHPDSIVLTRKDFQEIIHANPAFQAVFSALLLTKAILFVGYSFSDPDFQLLLERSLTLFRGYGPDRYALMNDIDPIEAGVLRRTAGIRAIPYTPSKPHHPEVPAFLRALAEEFQPEPGIRMMVEAGRGASFSTSRRPVRKVLRLDELLADESGNRELDIDSKELRELLGRSLAVSSETLGSRPRNVRPQETGTRGGTRDGTRDHTGPGTPPIATTPTDPRSTSFGAETPSPKPSAPAAAVQSWHLAIEPGLGLLNWALEGPFGPRSRASEAPRWAEVQAALRTQRHATVAGKLADTGLPELLQPVAAGSALTLALPPSLEQYPWEWVEVEGEPLCLRYRLTRAPVGVSDAARGLPGFGSEVSLLVLGDPTDQLPGARREAEAVADLWAKRPGSYVKELYGTEASVDRATAELLSGAYDMVHFAGHAWADAEGAYLRLARNEKLRSDTMRSLLSSRPPALLFLNSHYTAFVPAGVELPPDDEQGTARLPASGSGHAGFTEAAGVSGVASFIGCLGSPMDEAAADLAIHFHRLLTEGTAVDEAMLQARRQLRSRHPAGYDWSYFVLSGQGDLVIPFPP